MSVAGGGCLLGALGFAFSDTLPTDSMHAIVHGHMSEPCDLCTLCGESAITLIHSILDGLHCLISLLACVLFFFVFAQFLFDIAPASGLHLLYWAINDLSDPARQD